jgi:transcriptional regulator with XRE-family HTH domain
MIKEYIAFITSLRKEKGFSQARVAEILGISRTSYIDVEKGTKELSVSELEKLANIYGLSVDQILSSSFSNYEKYKDMLLAYLRMNLTHKKDGKVTKTKLAKLLYLADFAWYYEQMQSMSGMSYRRIEYGPVPDAFFRAITELEESGKIMVEKKDDDGKVMFLISESQSNKNQKIIFLSKEEQGLLKKIATKWGDKKTTDIVNFTHNQLPYSLCRDNELIPYELIVQEDPDKVY